MEKQKRSAKKITNSILTATFIVVLAALTASLVWMFVQISRGGGAQLFGYRLYMVVSDSMTPELNVGDVILSRSAEGQTIEVGDVVTFMGQTGSQKGKIITHKVVEAPYVEDGQTYIRTRGVKEGAPLDAPIKLEYVSGIFIKKLAAIGGLLRFVMKPVGFVLVIALPLMLLTLYQLYRLAKMSVKNKRDPNGKG